MKPMLARTYGPKYKKFPCYIQPKIDGVRALYQRGVLQSRDEKLWQLPFFKHIQDELETLYSILGTSILDGELYHHGWKLQRINKAMAVNATVRGPNEDTSNIEYYIFDQVKLNQPFSERWLDLSNELRANPLPHIKIVDTSYVYDVAQMERYFHMATADGYEGVILRPDGLYEFGETAHGTTKRSQFLWKHKQWTDEEFICTGVTQGEGKAAIGIGAIEFQPLDHCWEVPCKVGTGFDDSERIEFMLNPPIGCKIRVRYLFLTEDGKPFNGSFIAVMPS